MDDPSKEENNNCCSNQGIDAVVYDNTQEQTSLLVTLCDVAAFIFIVSQQSSPQQMQSYQSATNIIATNMLNLYRTHHTTASQRTRPFLLQTELWWTQPHCITHQRGPKQTTPHRNKQNRNNRNHILPYCITLHRTATNHQELHRTGTDQTITNASHTNGDQNKQHLTTTNRTAIIAFTSYRIVSHCIGRQ